MPETYHVHNDSLFVIMVLSNTHARQIMEVDGLHATVDHNFSCEKEVSINIEATDDNAFKGDRAGLQKLLGGVRAALGFECDSILSALILLER